MNGYLFIPKTNSNNSLKNSQTELRKIIYALILTHLPSVKGTQQIFQRCLSVSVRLIWGREVGQSQINVVYFNVDSKNVRQRRNNVVNMNNCNKLKNKLWATNIIIFLSFNETNSNRILWTQNSPHFIPHFQEYM